MYKRPRVMEGGEEKNQSEMVWLTLRKSRFELDKSMFSRNMHVMMDIIKNKKPHGKVDKLMEKNPKAFQELKDTIEDDDGPIAFQELKDTIEDDVDPIEIEKEKENKQESKELVLPDIVPPSVYRMYFRRIGNSFLKRSSIYEADEPELKPRTLFTLASLNFECQSVLNPFVPKIVDSTVRQAFSLQLLETYFKCSTKYLFNEEVNTPIYEYAIHLVYLYQLYMVYCECLPGVESTIKSEMEDELKFVFANLQYREQYNEIDKLHVVWNLFLKWCGSKALHLLGEFVDKEFICKYINKFFSGKKWIKCPGDIVFVRKSVKVPDPSEELDPLANLAPDNKCAVIDICVVVSPPLQKSIYLKQLCNGIQWSCPVDQTQFWHELDDGDRENVRASFMFSPLSKYSDIVKLVGAE